MTHRFLAGLLLLLQFSASVMATPDVVSSGWETTSEVGQSEVATLDLPSSALERTRLFLLLGEERSSQLRSPRLRVTPGEDGGLPKVELLQSNPASLLRSTLVLRSSRVHTGGFELHFNLRVRVGKSAPKAELRVSLERRGEALSVRWEGPFPIVSLQPMKSRLPSIRVLRGGVGVRISEVAFERMLVHAECTGRLPPADTPRLRPRLRGLLLPLTPPTGAHDRPGRQLQATEIEGCDVRLLSLGRGSRERWRRVVRFGLGNEPYYFLIVMTPKAGEIRGPYLDLPELPAEIPDLERTKGVRPLEGR